VHWVPATCRAFGKRLKKSKNLQEIVGKKKSF